MDYRKFIKSTSNVCLGNTQDVKPVTTYDNTVTYILGDSNDIVEDVEATSSNDTTPEIIETTITETSDEATGDDQFEEVSSVDAASLADKMLNSSNNWDTMASGKGIEFNEGSDIDATNMVAKVEINNATGTVTTSPFQDQVIDMLSYLANNVRELKENSNCNDGNLYNEEIMDSEKIIEYLKYMYNEFEESYLNDLPILTDLHPGMYNILANIPSQMQELIRWCSNNVPPVLNPLYILYPFFIDIEDKNAYFKFLHVYYNSIVQFYDVIENKAAEFDEAATKTDNEYLDSINDEGEDDSNECDENE